MGRLAADVPLVVVRGAWLAALLAVGCSAPAARPPAPATTPVTAPPASAPGMTAGCQQADALRQRVASLEAAGKLHRLVRVVSEADRLCASGAPGTWTPLLRAWRWLGTTPATAAQASAIAAHPLASSEVRALASDVLATPPLAGDTAPSAGRWEQLRRAEGALHEGRPADAEPLALAAWSVDHRFPHAIAIAGLAALALGHADEAQRRFDRALAEASAQTGAPLAWKLLDPSEHLDSFATTMAMTHGRQGSMVWASSGSGWTPRWLLDTRDAPAPPRSVRGQASRMARVTPSGALLITGTWQGDLALWNLTTGQRRSLPAVRDGDLRGVALSPSGRRVALAVDHYSTSPGQPPSEVRVLDLTSDAPPVVLTEPRLDAIDAIAFGDSDDRVVVATEWRRSGVGTVVWDVPARKVARSSPWQGKLLSRDGRWLASSGAMVDLRLDRSVWQFLSPGDRAPYGRSAARFEGDQDQYLVIDRVPAGEGPSRLTRTDRLDPTGLSVDELTRLRRARLARDPSLSQLSTHDCGLRSESNGGRTVRERPLLCPRWYKPYLLPSEGDMLVADREVVAVISQDREPRVRHVWARGVPASEQQERARSLYSQRKAQWARAEERVLALPGYHGLLGVDADTTDPEGALAYRDEQERVRFLPSFPPTLHSLPTNPGIDTVFSLSSGMWFDHRLGALRSWHLATGRETVAPDDDLELAYLPQGWKSWWMAHVAPTAIAQIDESGVLLRDATDLHPRGMVWVDASGAVAATSTDGSVEAPSTERLTDAFVCLVGPFVFDARVCAERSLVDDLSGRLLRGEDTAQPL